MVDSAGVAVWLAPAATADALAPLLTAQERARAERFVPERVRQTWIASRGALRLVLAHHLSCSPAALTFALEERGKPFVPGRPVEFNVSHSGDLAAVAVAQAGCPVGVDVEERRPVQRERGVAEQVMTPAELARYEKLPPDERTAFLLWLWARKEALLKVSGQGVAETLRAFPCEPAHDSRWSVVDLDVPGYASAVAAAGRAWSARLRNIDELIHAVGR